MPAAPLDAAIALSILFLGPEIVRVARRDELHHPAPLGGCVRLRASARVRIRGRADRLGLPRDEIPLALLLFNVGVEAGQLAFVLLVTMLERAFRVLEVRRPPLAVRVPGYVVGTLGAFWTITYLTRMVTG